MAFEYKEVKQDVFEMVEGFNQSEPDLVMLVQTISGDCVMGAGIAKEIEDRYGFRSSLLMEEGDGRGYLSGSWKFSNNGCFINRDGERMKLSYPIGQIARVDTYYLDPRFGSMWHFLPVAVVTKEKYYEKPTLETMKLGLEGLKDYIDGLHWCNEMDDENPFRAIHLIMPTIGCGLDKLDWADVSGLIHEVFGVYENTDDTVKITVCIK